MSQTRVVSAAALHSTVQHLSPTHGTTSILQHIPGDAIILCLWGTFTEGSLSFKSPNGLQLSAESYLFYLLLIACYLGQDTETLVTAGFVTAGFKPSRITG